MTAPELDQQSGTAEPGLLASRLQQSLAMLLIIGVAVALYFPMLDDYFQTDDFIFLRAAGYADLPTYVEGAFDFTGYDRHEELIDFLRDDDIAVPFLSYRPLYFVLLKLMNMAFGDNVTGYHLVSLGVHVANIVLVWLIAKRLLNGSLAPLAAAAIFAVHPAYVAAVAWISDIATPGATCFALLALLLFMRSIEEEKTNLAYYTASVGAALAAILFHQQAITWAGVIVVYGFLNEYRRGESWPFQRAWDWAVPFAILALGAIFLHSYITAHTPVHQEELGVGTYMITHFKNLGAGSVYPIATGNEAVQLLALGGLLVFLAGTPILWLRLGDKRTLLSAIFCVVWFIAAMVPLLTLDDFFGPGILFRKLYVVGPSLSILLALAGQGLVRRFPFEGRPLWAAGASLILFLALAGSLHRASERRDEVTANADMWATYAAELRERYPTLPEGTTIYVVSPPDQTRSFGDVYIVASAQALYGKVNAEVLDRWRNSITPSAFERVFIYPKSE